MKLVIGGVRGTNPVAQPDFMRYGGETTSFLIEGSGGERVLIDAGTGVRELGRYLLSSVGRDVFMLMTHYHLDHVTGLPSLGLLYDPAWSLTIAAPAHDDIQVEATMSRVMHKPFWPLQVEDVGASVSFRALDGTSSRAPLAYGGLEIRWCPLHHPGGCTAYRVDEPATGTSVVVATDMEWSLSSAEERAALESLVRGDFPPSVMLMDGQYQPDELKGHSGWGHSTWREVAACAAAWGVGRMLVTHHDPSRSDAQLDGVRAALLAESGVTDLARERQELVL